MKLSIRLFTVAILMNGALYIPPSLAADNYSSEYTRKWAAQRAAEQERARQREEAFRERQRRQQELEKSMTQIFNVEEQLGGTDINKVPQRRRPQTVDPQPAYQGNGVANNPLPDAMPHSGLFGAPLEQDYVPSPKRQPHYVGEGPCRRNLNADAPGQLGSGFRCGQYLRQQIEKECGKNHYTEDYRWCEMRVKDRVLESM